MADSWPLAEPLHTARLVLRMFHADDFPAVAEMYGDPEAMRYIADGTTVAPGQAWRAMAAMLGHWHLRGCGQFAIADRATDELIGRTGLWFPEGWPGVEIGWMIRRRYWRQGYALEASRAAMQHAFAVLEVPKLISLIHPENIASRRLAERLGERFESETTLFDRPAQVFAITREEWLAKQAETQAQQ